MSARHLTAPAGYHAGVNAFLAGVNALWATVVGYGPGSGVTALVAAACAAVIVGVLVQLVQAKYLRARTGQRPNMGDPLYLRQMILLAVLIGGVVGFFAGSVFIGITAAGGLSFAAIHHHQKARARTAA